MKALLFFLSLFPLCVCTAAPVVTHLDNGLTVIIKENHRAPMVISQVWYRVGSADEPNGITGIAHALEHMMFRGTPKISAKQFTRTITENGGFNNAATSRDYTYYYEVMPSQHLDLVLQLEADRMQHLNLSPEDFSKEIQVVREERRMRTDDNPQALTMERFNAVAFASNPYHHPTVGWPSDLVHMTAGDLRHWYQQWYTPNNAAIVIAGDVTPKKALALVKQFFGHIPQRALPIVKPHPDQTPMGKKRVTVKRPAKLPWLIMGFSAPHLSADEKAWQPYALMILSAVLSGDDSARLPTILARKKQIVTSVNANYSPFQRFDTQFTIVATPAKDKSMKEVKKAIWQQLTRLKKQAVKPTILKQIVHQIEAERIYQRDDLTDQASELGALFALGLPMNTPEQLISHLKTITPAQLQMAAKQFFVRDRLTVGVLVPENKG
ncbi:MAG: zinc protease [marine bacterium B5-7]|nr:MAG: zinc protease [marine bacterium B5-7]